MTTPEQKEINLNQELPFVENQTQKTEESNSSDEENFEIENEDYCFVKLSSYSIKEFRLIKNAIEDALIRKCKHLDSFETTNEQERYVCYFKNYSIDKIGKPVTHGETGIAEGWNVPIYENEFQNLLGLPFHEDNALSETLRIKKPRLECFNCLATNHRVTECPVKIDDDRIKIHRKIFANQSIQAQEQAELFSTRYTNDSKDNRGFMPGKVSTQLRQALGIRDNQLPPFIYLMRELGYPVGWLIEAQVKKSDLELVHDEENNGEKTEESTEKKPIEYDAEKIFSYPGFNEPLPKDTIDESDRYGVEKYGQKFSKEAFLKTLNLRKKRSFRRTMTKSEMETAESEVEEEKSNESIEDGMIQSDDEEKEESAPQAKKQKSLGEKHGTAVIAIPGTPIIDNITNVNQVPNWEKFSQNICEHKPFDMENMSTSGSYQNIVKLTRDYKNKPTNSSS